MAGGRKWTQDERETLRRMISDRAPDEIALLLDRSSEAVKLAAYKMGLRFTAPKGEWTKADRDRLRKFVAEGAGVRAIAGHLKRPRRDVKQELRSLEIATKVPRKWTDGEVSDCHAAVGRLTADELAVHLQRSAAAVDRKCRELGIKLHCGPSTTKHRRWCHADIVFLRDMSPTLSCKEIAFTLGRSFISVRAVAYRLGITVKGARERNSSKASPLQPAMSSKRKKDGKPRSSVSDRVQLAWCDMCHAPVVNTVAGWVGHRGRTQCAGKAKVY